MATVREQMMQDMVVKGYSEHTQKAYVREVSQFSQYFNTCPTRVGGKEIKDYLHHLIAERQLSQSKVSQAYSAFKFLYETTLHRDWDLYKIPVTKKAKKLPVVLSRQEVSRIFDVTKNLKHNALLKILYSSGLRVAEAVALKITDIDSDRMLIRVQGKGNKQRQTLLARDGLNGLREYCRRYHPNDWLFPGANPEAHLTTRSVQKLVQKVAQDAGITKPVTPHVFRHTFSMPASPSLISKNSSATTTSGLPPSTSTSPPKTSGTSRIL
jgi:integrase/recombinase XerD